MDVLKPDLLNIKGRCFRINPMNINLDENTSQKNFSSCKNTYEDEDCTLDYNNSEEEEEDNCVIEPIDSNRYRTAFHVARVYFGYIIGAKGATQKRLESETKTHINVPKLGQDGDIVITGRSRTGIQTAYRRINSIIMTARRKRQSTHFISIPFFGENVKKRFLEFKREVLEVCKDRRIEESVFQSPDKLHLTVCVMVLSDDVERKTASRVLQECKKEVVDKLLDGRSLKIKIRGIEIMNDDPAEVRVLFGKVHCEDDNLLQSLADEIVNYYVKAGIIENREYDRVKLHVTLMNTKYSEMNTVVENHNERNRKTMNVTSILKHFEDYDFGEEVVDTIHLSQMMGSANFSGYYKSSCTINL